MHALVRMDLGDPFPLGEWSAIVESTRELVPAWLGFAQLWLAGRQREANDLAAAAASLQQARASGLGSSSNFVAERMHQALAAGDAAAAVAAAEEGLAVDQTWPMLNVAAAGLFAAVRHAASADRAWTARAIAVQEQVLPELPHAPGLPVHLRELFVAQGNVRLALLQPPSEASPHSLAGAVETLDRLRGNVEASWWDESLWSSARDAARQPNR